MSADQPAGGPPGVRYTRDVGPGDLPVRVSLRRRLPDGALGDVLGVLQTWKDGVLTVLRRDETHVTVDEADVLALKRVPPLPERRR